MSYASTSTLLADRFQQLKQKQENQMNGASSIENTVGKTINNTSIELPQEISELNTGSDYWKLAKANRYKKLIREGHLDKLMSLAKMAQSKDSPANWFARACSKKFWERTLAYFAKLAEVAATADRVARKIGTEVNKFIYKQIWKGKAVERWATKAQEVGKDSAKYFAWLCVNEKKLLEAEKAQT